MNVNNNGKQQLTEDEKQALWMLSESDFLTKLAQNLLLLEPDKKNISIRMLNAIDCMKVRAIGLRRLARTYTNRSFKSLEKQFNNEIKTALEQ